ncbi:MAG: radical SAM/SPASM domain-containing protein [Chitinophagales bacterium]|nr:SPASM domain-containing protein [Chitinophagales bacterium]MDW8273086.1 radical SAM/SPASM domain-containing protein [Chitinophagales bacterium]
MKAKVRDTINFLSKLTLRKIINFLKVYFSFSLSRRFGKPWHWGMPVTISIEPTTHCNLGCPECPSGLKIFTRPTGNLNTNNYQKLIDEAHHKSIFAYFYFQGEPYMHPQFNEMVNYASKKKLYCVTSTNGHFLTSRRALQTVESGLDRIIISIDGTTQETYEKYRQGGDLNKVLQGVENLVIAKKQLKSNKPYIIIQFIVMRHNEHQMSEIALLGKKLGVDEVKFKTAQIYNYEKGSELIPSEPKYSRYKKVDNKYVIKNKQYNYCWRMWQGTVVTWDGQCVPCCFDKDAEHALGNAFESSLKEVWQGTNYSNFRRKLMAGRKEINICNNCTEGLKVWI